MAIQVIPKKIQEIWYEWNVRGAVLVSLFLQIFLIFSAPSRKRTASYTIQFPVWSAYVMADWIAVFAIGLITNSQQENCEKGTLNDALAAFWAPFLLLHLGGPDTITAFSLEDNGLWIRHLLGLMVQLLAVAYIISQSIPNDFWIPTVLVFLAGFIKYAERTRALYLACLVNFKDYMRSKPDPEPDYAELRQEYAVKMKAIKMLHVPEKRDTYFGMEDIEKLQKLDEIKILLRGYRFYNIFKGLIVDNVFSPRERNHSRMYFFKLPPQAAFRLMEVELNFMYDALYTKMAAVHNGIFGYIFRFFCNATVVAAFVLFMSHHKPSHIHRFDIAITYGLLVGAIFLDLIALVKLIFSDWTIVLLDHLKHLNVESIILTIQRRISFGSRWSKTLYQHSLISYSLKKGLASFFGLERILEEIIHKRTEKVDEDLMEFIFYELRDKARGVTYAKDALKMHSDRGAWTLLNDIKGIEIPTSIMVSVSEDVEYDRSILMWHIATDLLFFTCIDINNKNRKWCKLLSDYLLYLLIMRSTMMSSVTGIAQIRFYDTCAEAKKLFSRLPNMKEEREVCEILLSVNTNVKHERAKGDRSKSLLFDACFLAQDLKKMDGHMWEIMTKVWVELLCYGASRCGGHAHAQQLRQGGEFITFIWLLMAHFGLGDHFRIEAVTT